MRLGTELKLSYASDNRPCELIKNKKIKKPNQTQKNPSIPYNPSPLSSFLSHSTKPTLQFPFNPPTLTLTHCATHIRPLAAVKAPKKIEKLVTDISSLTLKEASILVDDLQDKLDVSIAALTPAATVAIALGAGEAPPSWRKRRSSMLSSRRC
ncbi:hypothetical protein DVH24_038537 [Malus domestica]|uniref:Large ribosomal subunit protein bL12 oligomerization domain-containing protein n=1 Tax=Malus domestica TaxID=3750 RepID=A0A498KFL6_MALDO|nr:hypothetical protein DVH24_038537 [Malus domestica]